MIDWSKHIFATEEVLAECREGTSVAESIRKIEARTGLRGITYDSLKDACKRHLGASPTQIIGARYQAPISESSDPVDTITFHGVPKNERVDIVDLDVERKAGKCCEKQPDIDRLMQECRKGQTFENLCDRLGLSPKSTRELIQLAQESGRRVDVDGDTVHWAEDKPEADDGETVDIPIKQVKGWTKFAVISDTHFGSKFCMRKQIKDFLRYAVDKRGCMLALHAGDWTEGIEAKVRGELSHHDFHSQMQDMHEHMPHDIEIVSIYGNHDAWHAKHSGMDVARAINDTLQGYGRLNIRVVGGMNKLLQVGGLKVRLTHPSGGSAYAKSYPAQKWTRDLESASGRKPHIWLFGHRHRYVHFVDRGMHVFDVPCWQGGGSDFGKRLHGQPAIGGLIVEAG